MCSELSDSVKNVTDEVLGLPEYFFCEKNRCKLRIDVCIQRQKLNEQKKPFSPKISFMDCANCQQGAENWALKHPAKSLKKNPRRGRGKRTESCEFYSDCLGVVAKKDWKSFNCESCQLYSSEATAVNIDKSKNKNTRICEECKEAPTITPKHALCASCLGKRSRPKNRGDSKSSQGQKPFENKTKVDKYVSNESDAVTIKFGRYVLALREIEKLAESEVRTVELQVIFILKKWLDMAKETAT